jgi:hypothetical protein
MFERFLYRLVYILFGLVLWMSMTNPAKADLYYDTYQGTGATPSFPGNGGSLTYPTKLSSGTLSSIDYNWGSGVVLDSGQSERVIVHIYGYITIPGSGSQDIQFYLYADDGVYMKLDDTVVINDWQEQGAGTWNYVSTDQTLTGGQTYYIDMWWYENGGGAAVKLYWDQTGSVVLVPSSAYSTTIPTPTYSSDPTAAQLQSRTDARNITPNGNEIYITQSGNNLDLDIVQYDNDQLVAGTGSTSSNLTDATITGDDNTVSITQGNSAGSFSDDNVTLLDINGTNNSVTVRQGDNVDDAGGHRLKLNVTGNYNTMGILQENDGGIGSDGHFMDVDVNGNSNTAYADQKDDGDKMLFLDVNGGSNNIDILQQGTGEHFLDVTLGSNQTVDINQDGSGSHSATIDMSGYSATLDLDQTGSTDQTYSLNQICTNANGCGTTTINQN